MDGHWMGSTNFWIYQSCILQYGDHDYGHFDGRNVIFKRNLFEVKMRNLFICLILLAAAGPTVPDNYPPQPPKGPNGPAQPRT